MQESRELAKKNWKGSGDAAVEDIWFGIRDKLGATEFLGYETNQAEGMILSLLKDNKEVKELKSNDEGMIITNQTPFYGESGGQVGDRSTHLAPRNIGWCRRGAGSTPTRASQTPRQRWLEGRPTAGSSQKHQR